MKNQKHRDFEFSTGSERGPSERPVAVVAGPSDSFQRCVDG